MRPKLARVGVTRIARVTGLDHVRVAVSVAVRPLSRTLSVSQGKGVSAELADASAAMESIELWHSEEARPPELHGSYAELAAAGHPVVDPVTLRPGGPFPHSADLRSEACGWLAGHNLASGKPCFVPHYFCSIRSDQAQPAHLTSVVDSTGLAGGNTIEEATCHALCEVIERDATARFEALDSDAQDARELNLATVTGPARQLIDKIEAAELRVQLWDQSSHVGLPAFGCTIQGVDEFRGLGLFDGYGAHLDPEVAVCRATSEAVQSRLTIISGARDDQPPTTYQAMQLSQGVARAPTPPRHSFAKAPKCQTTGSFRGDLRLLVRLLVAADFPDVIRVDLSQPEIGIPVVFVFVPSAKVLFE